MRVSKFLSPSLAAAMAAGYLLFPAAGFAADADSGNGQPGTVNYFTPAQKTRAFNAASQAGYTPTLVESFQDRNFYLTARKNGQIYELTVVPSGQIYPSSPSVPTS